jgi:hypothetical protein
VVGHGWGGWLWLVWLVMADRVQVLDFVPKSYVFFRHVANVQIERTPLSFFSRYNSTMLQCSGTVLGALSSFQ